ESTGAAQGADPRAGDRPCARRCAGGRECRRPARRGGGGAGAGAFLRLPDPRRAGGGVGGRRRAPRRSGAGGERLGGRAAGAPARDGVAHGRVHPAALRDQRRGAHHRDGPDFAHGPAALHAAEPGGRLRSTAPAAGRHRHRRARAARRGVQHHHRGDHLQGGHL
ncbi:MAG: hypothetical protein AVDCRST_MAG68-269, partial [uncultured Gemmatimonadetes bacterium]